jgi:hypothetical protein
MVSCVRLKDLFHPKELQAMVVGNELYDWKLLIRFVFGFRIS